MIEDRKDGKREGRRMKWMAGGKESGRKDWE